MLNYSINNKNPIYRGDGKVVGYTEGQTLHKTVKGDKHMLQKPHGWAWDTDILAEAARRDVISVEIYDRESSNTYIATIQAFWDFGVGLNRGFGDQICLPIKYWQIDRPGQPPQPPRLPFEPNTPNMPHPQMALPI